MKLIELYNEIIVNKPINVEKILWGDWEKLISNLPEEDKSFEDFGYRNEGLWKFIKNLPTSQKIKFYNRLKSKQK